MVNFVRFVRLASVQGENPNFHSPTVTLRDSVSADNSYIDSFHSSLKNKGSRQYFLDHRCSSAKIDQNVTFSSF